ncbi:MAG: ATP-binding protein [Patescibacteria group bacterium]|nr:ATP-binding protein [Patescibacteria group bacterium]
MEIPFFKNKSKKVKLPEIKFDADVLNVADIIAPSSLNIESNYLKIGERFAESFFVFSYPRYLHMGWFSPIINLDIPMDISLFFHPIDSGIILKKLRKKITEIQAQIMEKEEKGLIRDPTLETARDDIEKLRDRLQTAQERMFKFGLYITGYTDDKKGLEDIETTLRSLLESKLIYIKPTLYQPLKGFTSTSPYGIDNLDVHVMMNTGPLSSIFPFISMDLTSNSGILYGINQHNNSLVLFDRFALENSNSTVFGVTGSGKSFFVKLEILRYMMTGVDVIVVDPENEYEFLSDATGGSFIKLSLSSEDHINPFDLPAPREDESSADVLRSNVINLVGLMRLLLGGLNPEEDSVMDRAITETYAARDITPESNPKTWPEKIPLMEDLVSVLETMDGAKSLVRRLRKFTSGSYGDFFNHQTNVKTNNQLVVFGIRDLEEELRPMAMFVTMRYVWNLVRSELKKRILVIDEAWCLMQSEDGASFLFGTVKRARKYWLGVTTITQDVNDFMKSSYGQPIITNSALHFLLKQSPATIDVVQKTFNLTEEEKYTLLETNIGEGLFFAGKKHVILRVAASYTEEQIITTTPQEVLRARRAKKQLAQKK